MLSRIALLGLGALILLGASCAGPPSYRLEKYPPIQGVEPGDSPKEVRAALKADPVLIEPGYWTDSYRFEMKYDVWHFKKIGRVVFDRFDMSVITSEADPQ